MPLVQWPPRGPHTPGEIEKPIDAKMGSRMPTDAPKRGLLIDRDAIRLVMILIVCAVPLRRPLGRVVMA